MRPISVPCLSKRRSVEPWYGDLLHTCIPSPHPAYTFPCVSHLTDVSRAETLTYSHQERLEAVSRGESVTAVTNANRPLTHRCRQTQRPSGFSVMVPQHPHPARPPTAKSHHTRICDFSSDRLQPTRSSHGALKSRVQMPRAMDMAGVGDVTCRRVRRKGNPIWVLETICHNANCPTMRLKHVDLRWELTGMAKTLLEAVRRVGKPNGRSRRSDVGASRRWLLVAVPGQGGR